MDKTANDSETPVSTGKHEIEDRLENCLLIYVRGIWHLLAILITVVLCVTENEEEEEEDFA